DGRPARSTELLLAGKAVHSPAASRNTTLVCLISTIPFEPASLRRLAIEGQAGLARAVRPAHTVVDGDVVFALAPPADRAPDLPTRLRAGAAAAEATAAAIADAVRPR
ncbi:MAG TPA: P1 family peptidase, partial [Thermoanaerobaculia bacterium]